MEKASVFFKRAMLGILLGVLGLTLLLGTDYNGAGMEIISRAIEMGSARPTAFLWKLVFTAITIGCGFKGGEVVPSFFVGAASDVSSAICPNAYSQH